MTISGGIKFFKKSKNFETDGASAVASSGSASAPFILDRNSYTCYRSVGSDDSTTEIITVTIPFMITVSRLFLIDHNLKNYTVEYDVGGVWTAFTNVQGIDGSKSGITETANTNSTTYYEFDSISTTSFRISATETLTVDAEKFLTFFVTTEELGTLEGFPEVKSVTKDRNLRKKKTLNNRMFVQKSIEVKKFDIQFKDYPSNLTADLELMETLYDRDEAFNVWLCGGRTGSTYFGYQFKGFQLRDLIQVQVTNNFRDSYRKNFYNGAVKMKVVLEEST